MCSVSATTSGQRLVDYFVVCGLDSVSGLEPDQLLGDSLHVAPLERSYKAKTLAHYPDNVDWNPFDEHAVCMLSLPNGLRFKLNTDACAPVFHSFLITREDGSRMHGYALTFYEKVKDYAICQAMQVLQDMHVAELASASTATRSHSALPLASDLRDLQAKPPSEERLYNSEEHNLLVAKSIGLVMPLPFTSAARTCLDCIYNGGLKENELNLTLECFIYNLIYEVPLPPPGRNMKFTCVQEDVLCQRPGLNELPLFDYPIEEVFRLMDAKNFLKLLTCVMLEHQILFVGSDLYTFMLLAETITSLVFPFLWQHVYVPILPASLLHFLEAPVPFVMGLYCENTVDREQLPLPSEASLCLLDFENRKFRFPEELPELPYSEELMQELSEVVNTCRGGKEASNNAVNIAKNASSPSLGKRIAKQEARLTARKPVKKIDALKAGLSQLKSSRSTSQLPDGKNPRLASLEKIAQTTGIQTTTEKDKNATAPLERALSPEGVARDDVPTNSAGQRQAAFNVKVREILLNWFTQVFLDYDTFVIQPRASDDLDQWIQNREQMENFDKAAFLSDQPAHFLPFLAPFIESQMFATFVDTKLIGGWSEADPRLAVFDQRISQVKTKLGIARSHCYEKCQTIKNALQVLSRRCSTIDHMAPIPHVLDVEIRRAFGDGFFPDLNDEALVADKVDSGRRQTKINWRKRDRQKQHSEHLLLNNAMKQDGKKIRQKLAVSIKKYLQESKATVAPHSQLGDMSLNSSDAHITFIQKLLTECKAKTKRMLVLKMGQEAIDLGHNDVNVSGVEENTLVASLCDLLDRIWGHGLNTRKAKSPLWFHLVSYYEGNSGDELDLSEDNLLPGGRSCESSPNVPRRPHMRRSTSPEPSRLRNDYPAGQRHRSPARSLMADISRDRSHSPNPLTRVRKSHERRSTSPNLRVQAIACESEPLNILVPTISIFTPAQHIEKLNLLKAIRSVKNLSEIKTDTGCLRAFVRLALEKKALSKHLRTLLDERDILRKYYKNYAFVRTEEEREQFLVYILSLNAVDYFCFTNCFSTLAITYKVVIVTGKQLGGSTTTANVWMILAGDNKDTGVVAVPKSECEFRFQHPNLGKLTTLRIGHDNSGYAPGWFVDNIVVRNEITGHLYRFPCGRWLAKNNDDGSTERLLVAELQTKLNTNNNLEAMIRQKKLKQDTLNSSSSPQRPSPVLLRKSPEKTTVPVVQERVANSVNKIVKFFCGETGERGYLTYLLCGEGGLCDSLDQVFQCGFKSSRLFQKNFFIWDFIEKVYQYYHSEEGFTVGDENRRAMSTFISVVEKINNASQTVGKDGKFQTFVCLGARDHYLQIWFPLISVCPVTAQMYEQNSFLRDKDMIEFLVGVLRSLLEFNIVLESSLLKGIS